MVYSHRPDHGHQIIDPVTRKMRANSILALKAPPGRSFSKNLLFDNRENPGGAALCFFLTGGETKFKMEVRKGGEVHEMDVSPCNSLFDLRFLVLVLSTTLNGSSKRKKDYQDFERPANFFPAFSLFKYFDRHVLAPLKQDRRLGVRDCTDEITRSRSVR